MHELRKDMLLGRWVAVLSESLDTIGIYSAAGRYTERNKLRFMSGQGTGDPSRNNFYTETRVICR